jgi:hypothetical protein
MVQMGGSFDSTELALFQRIVDLAALDLGILDEREKSLIAARVMLAAEQGKRDFDSLMAHAKRSIPHSA